MIEVNVEKIDGITTITLTGELDSISSEEVQQTILPLAEKNSRILLDMSNVTYMSSAGLRTLLLLYRRINENIGRVVLAGLREEVQDVMSITGFLDFFTTADTHTAARQALS